MKKKELKNFAKKIAKAELIIANSSDEAEIKDAKNEILYYSSQIRNLEDMLLIDDLIQKFLSEKS